MGGVEVKRWGEGECVKEVGVKRAGAVRTGVVKGRGRGEKWRGVNRKESVK